DNLFFFLLFLRITPIVPNIVINVASPIVGVPFKYYFFATLFGLMPANLMHVSTGHGISSMKQIGFDKNVNF
ncbi:VTT domain-containing protein, partial [Klebsiella pneumoniae]|uniref:VTT domain-containing protein n=1 Tax=Klebsiella pneumoniae TaxID=573 RepID=UPI0025A237D7